MRIVLELLFTYLAMGQVVFQYLYLYYKRHTPVHHETNGPRNWKEYLFYNFITMVMFPYPLYLFCKNL